MNISNPCIPPLHVITPYKYTALAGFSWYCYTVTLVHCYTVTLLHCYIVTPLHCYNLPNGVDSRRVAPSQQIKLTTCASRAGADPGGGSRGPRTPPGPQRGGPGPLFQNEENSIFYLFYLLSCYNASEQLSGHQISKCSWGAYSPSCIWNLSFKYWFIYDM